MTAIDRILQIYREAAVTEREKGTYFERLGLAYLRNDPVQVEEYEAVWTWSDWAKENDRDGRDVGIDLVAKLRNEDGFAAIQTKCYAADTRIQKAHIDSFISASGKEPFRRRVVLDTTEQEWGANAEEMIRGQTIPVVRIGLTDLRDSRIDWTIFEARGEIVLADKKTLRQHQRDALEDVRTGLAVADRGKMIMACGTGKTFTALKIAEDLAGKGKRVLFMVPSLALMSQTVREWTNDTDTPIRAFAVCSDAHVGKQKLIVELYDKFFRRAFPRTTEKLGIVYTPVEIVDFIIHSVNEVLQSEFGQTLGSPGVHIIDPFTGTGTFITRLLQSGLIAPEEMEHKFRHEIHANEIVLLAYYIAAINIEAVYHGLQGGDYVPFEGICLTDTFQMYESDDLISHYMPDNSERRKRQKATDIRVIVGNPPYSAGQGSANDDAANVSYPGLDTRIGETFARRSSATLQRGLYDSYVRAIRWASDRIGDAGIVAYVTNAGWVDGNAADGMRACLAEEFTDLYVFHLRGNQRTSGERSRKEGGKIFGSGSRAPIAISVFVKNPDVAERGRIFFHDIGDYLSREEKLKRVADFSHIGGIKLAAEWQVIEPNDHFDWLSQRDYSFENFIPIGAKRGSEIGIFENYTQGVMTSRDY